MRLSDWKQVSEEEGELKQYRDRTVGLLRKYFRMSIELGHLPALFGREFFRSNISSYQTHTFEDTVIFVHDMERVLEKLPPAAQDVIARIFFQEFTYDEAAALLGVSRRNLVRKVSDSLDTCARVLIDRGLLARSRESLTAMEARTLSRKDELPPKIDPVPVRMYQRPLFPRCCQVGRDGKIKLYC